MVLLEKNDDSVMFFASNSYQSSIASYAQLLPLWPYWNLVFRKGFQQSFLGFIWASGSKRHPFPPFQIVQYSFIVYNPEMSISLHFSVAIKELGTEPNCQFLGLSCYSGCFPFPHPTACTFFPLALSQEQGQQLGLPRPGTSRAKSAWCLNWCQSRAMNPN